MSKITFPKGSLKFKKLKNNNVVDVEKTPDWKQKLFAYEQREKFIKALANAKLPKDKLPPEQQQALADTEAQMKIMRKSFKGIPDFSVNTSYEITFKHPKWKFLEPVVLKTEKTTMKDTLKLIAHEFKKRKDSFRKFRTREKSVRINSLQSDIRYRTSGGIVYMPEIKTGVFFQFLKDQEKKIVYSNKLPKDKNANYVGIELEFMCDLNQEQLGLALFEAGLGKSVTLKTDGSIRCSHNARHRECPEHINKQFPHELAVLVTEANYKEVMKSVCSVLSKSNAQVNKSCGMHVHIDMRNRDVERAYQNLVSAQNILYKMNPKSRLDEHAKKLQERDFQKALRVDRHVGINPTAYSKYQTIEIRIHAGTIAFEKITNWVTILLKICNHSDRLLKTIMSLKTFCETFNVTDEKLINYMKERIDKFKIKDESLPAPEAERGVA